MQNIQENVSADKNPKAERGRTQGGRRISDSEKQIHTQFVQYGRNAKEWMRKCVMLLPEIERRGIWRKKGFGSIYEYAAKLAGMSKNTVDDALRILKKIEDKPALLAVAEARGLGAVRPVVTVATPKDEKFWAEKAAKMSKNTLEIYVRECRRQGGVVDTTIENNSALEFRPGTEFQVIQEQAHGVKPAKVEIAMDLDKATAEMLLKLKGPGDWNSLMQELLALREKKLEQEEPEPVVNAKRYIPVGIRKHVLKKTNGQCAYPGCNKPHQILHHTRRFALHPEHDPETLVPLCTAHERIAHHGLIEYEQGETARWKLRKEPELFSPEYAVDEMVMRYRAS